MAYALKPPLVLNSTVAILAFWGTKYFRRCPRTGTYAMSRDKLGSWGCPFWRSCDCAPLRHFTGHASRYNVTSPPVAYYRGCHMQVWGHAQWDVPFGGETSVSSRVSSQEELP